MAYSDQERTEALIQLSLQKYNWDATSKITGVPRSTLKRWAKSGPNKTVPELLERTISRLLMSIPFQIPAKDYGIILGILLDKWLILQGEPTERHESILGRLGEMSTDELDRIISDAERIAEESFSREPAGVLSED